MQSITVTEALARYIVGTAEVSEVALQAAQRALLDALGVALAGRQAPAVAPLRAQIAEWGGRPEASLWFTGQRVPAGPAALVNSVLVHALDLDDVHVPSTVHCTSVLVPTVLAVGQAVNASGGAVLGALVVGIEVATRLGRIHKVRCRHTGFLPTSVYGGFGAAAAASRLLGLSVEQTTEALGVFYAHAGGNRQALFDHSLAKRMQPGIAARAGIESAWLARRGLTGAHRVIEGKAGVYEIFGAAAGEPPPEAAAILEPRSCYAIEELSYKRWACCGASHPVLLAVLDLVTRHDLHAADISRIELFGLAPGFVGAPWEPEEGVNSQVLAQFCAPYEVAALVCHRAFGPAEVEPARIAADRIVSELAQRIQVCDRSAFGEDYPGGQTVRIHTLDGQVYSASRGVADVFAPAGGDDDVVRDKFAANAAYAGCSQAAALEDAVDHLVDLTDVNLFVEEFLHGDERVSV